MPFDMPPSPPASESPAPAAAVSPASPLNMLNASLAAAGSPTIAVTASDMVPLHGGSGLLGGQITGADGSVSYRLRAAAAASPNHELDQRFKAIDVQLLTGVPLLPGRFGFEAAHVGGFDLGVQPSDTRQQALSATRLNGVWVSPVNAGWLTEVRAGRTSYKLDGMADGYNSASVTALRDAAGLNTQVRIEHGGSGSISESYNLAAVDMRLTTALPYDSQLVATGGGQVARDAAPAPVLFTLGGQGRGSAYAFGAKAAPSGAYASVELRGPSVFFANVRPYVGVNGGVGIEQYCCKSPAPGALPSGRVASANYAAKGLTLLVP
jgi:hypothetical protein